MCSGISRYNLYDLYYVYDNIWHKEKFPNHYECIE